MNVLCIMFSVHVGSVSEANSTLTDFFQIFCSLWHYYETIFLHPSFLWFFLIYFWFILKCHPAFCCQFWENALRLYIEIFYAKSANLGTRIFDHFCWIFPRFLVSLWSPCWRSTRNTRRWSRECFTRISSLSGL